MREVAAKSVDALENKSKVGQLVLSKVFAIPGVKIDRATYLRRQLSKYCSDEQVEAAIKLGPRNAGVPKDRIDKLADACIRNHVGKASAISFATGLPGGWSLIFTIPADLAQFFGHATKLAQKLACLEGPPTGLEDGTDELTEAEITLLLGVMMGAEGAATGLAKLAELVAEKVVKDLPKKALTKTTFYPAVKSVAKSIGIQVTKQSFARGLGKVIPVVGGVVSAGMTATMMWPMARRLRRHFREMGEVRTKALAG